MKQVFGRFGSQLSSLMRYCVKRIILKLTGKIAKIDQETSCLCMLSLFPNFKDYECGKQN